MRTKRPFFIVGTPRSGTTLLQAMFMAVPGLYIPPETHFLALTKQREKINGPPSTDEGLENIIRVLSSMCERHELPVDLPALQQELRASERTYRGLFDTLLWHIQSRRPDCRRIGEKSPAHLQCVPELLEMFPDAQVITIVRDGRDVALSQEQTLGKTTLRAALGWRRDQRLHARYSVTLPPSQYTSVRYEDVVKRPDAELHRLCEFLNEPYSEAMINYHERREKGFSARETHKAMTMQPLTTARVGRYRHHLSRSKIALVQGLAWSELEANGYPLEPIGPLRGYVLAAVQAPRELGIQLKKKVV